MKKNQIDFLICIIFSLTLMLFAFSGCTNEEPKNQNHEEDIYSDDSFLSDDKDDEEQINDGFIPDCRKGYENINGNTHSNLYNGGIAAEQDGWIYFSTKPENRTSSSGKIFKHKSYETNYIEIASFDKSVSRLSVKGDYIYFLYGSDELYKMRTDGTEIQQVFYSDKIDCSNYMIVGDYIYVSQQENYSSASYAKYVVRYPVDDTDNCEKLYKLGEEEHYYGVTGKYIITKEKSRTGVKDTLLVYNTETKKTNKHTYEAENGYFFRSVQLTENAVFYTNDNTNAIVKLNLDDMSVSKSYNSYLVSQAFNFIDEDTIYFVYGNHTSEFYGTVSQIGKTSLSMIEQGNYKKILEENAGSICIVDDWIYYSTSGACKNYCRVKADGTGWEMLYEYVY